MNDEAYGVKGMRFMREEAYENGKQTAVLYRLVIDLEIHSFTIIANAEGVVIGGTSPILKSQDQIDELFKVIEWSHKHHLGFLKDGRPIPQSLLGNE